MIDPQAQSVLDEISRSGKPMAADQAAWLKEYRAELDAIVAMQGPPPEITIDERRVPIEDGATVGLRLYRPGRRTAWPTLLFIHGGGFVGGSLSGYDVPLRWLALRSGWQIASLDYRLAPEHPFPAARDDVVAALLYLLGGNDASVDCPRLAVGGDSAGGLLATVLARHARDYGIALVLQILLYPNTDLRLRTPHRSRQAQDGIIIRVDELYRSIDLYLGSTDRQRPDVSPLLSESLEGLCPAMLVINQYDPLKDEAEAYGRRLSAAGVATDIIRLEGSVHGVMQRAARIAIGDRLISALAETVRR